MVKVATRPAENPMGIMAKKLSLGKISFWEIDIRHNRYCLKTLVLLKELGFATTM